MGTLTRDEILALRAALPRRTVAVPDFGDVEIRMMTLKEVGAFQKKSQEAKGEPLRLYPELLRAACVAPDGRPLFDPGDAALLEDLPWPAVNALAVEVLKFNRMAGDDDPKAPAPSAGPSGSS